MAMNEYIVINPADNVAVALQALPKGTGLGKITLTEDIPAGHKIALKDLREGENVIKYGFPIGHLTSSVKAGSLIDHRNLRTNLGGLLEYSYNPAVCENVIIPGEKCSFRGFLRKNGDVGIRNQIWVIPTVGCVNGICGNIVEEFLGSMDRQGCRYGEMVGADPESGVDAVVAFPHNYGCSQLGDDHENTRRILADMVLHPNAGAVLVVSLGCENNQLEAFRELVAAICREQYGMEPDSSRIRFMECQKIEGDEIGYGVNVLKELFELCRNDRRSPQPLSGLKIGLKCGGSDGLSGITANPLLGEFSDWLVGQGGTTVLTEVPEMFGAETLLMNRCADRALFDKTVALINDFKNYFIRNGQPVYENPSPGNKAGGISTLEEKSLGCTQKSGRTAVRGVLGYGERLRDKGLNLLSSPGNDLVASTALGAAGCQMVLFTTGRGTPFGSFVPTLKVSTNTPLAVRKCDWIDFNAGRLADGSGTMPQVLEDFIAAVLAHANGEPLKSETRRIREIAIFKTGVTL